MRPLPARFTRLLLTVRPLPWRVVAAGAGGAILVCIGLAAWALFFASQAPAIPPPLPVVDEVAPVAVSPTDAEGVAPAAAVPPPADSPFAGITEPVPAPLRRTGIVEHRVEAGEVLWQIAERYGLRSETLIWANDLEDPDLLLIGQTLLILPEDGVLYTVQPGDRLADVAWRYGVDLAAVVRANRLSNSDDLRADTDIFLPGARPLLRAGGVGQQADVVQAPPSEEDQQAAGVLPPVPLPAHIADLLSAGWLRADRETVLFRGAERNARPLHKLPPGARLERVEGFKGGRIQVRDPGDGRTRQAMTGWVDAFDLAVGRALAPRELPVAYPESTAMDIAHVFAPYRSQLDGSPFAEANCGPVTIGMALETFGISVSSRQLRAEVLDAQRIWGHNVGTLMTALAQVVEGHGLRTHDLYARGGGLYRWSLDDIREHLAQGRPVVVQVRYRSLPGRGGAYYYGDHYILVTGVLGNGFIYNDPIDVDGIGWDRVISGERLRVAMDASDRRYAYAAFAVSR